MKIEDIYLHRNHPKRISFINHPEGPSRDNLKALKKEEVAQRAPKNLQKKAPQSHLEKE